MIDLLNPRVSNVFEIASPEHISYCSQAGWNDEQRLLAKMIWQWTLGLNAL